MSTYRVRWMTLEGDAPATRTTLAVSGAHAERHDVVMVPRTGEMMRVDGVKDGAVSVERGRGTRALPLIDGDEMVIVGRDEAVGS